MKKNLMTLIAVALLLAAPMVAMAQTEVQADLTLRIAERDSALVHGNLAEVERLTPVIAHLQELAGDSTATDTPRVEERDLTPAEVYAPLPDEINPPPSSGLTAEEEVMVGIHPDTLAAMRAEIQKLREQNQRLLDLLREQNAQPRTTEGKPTPPPYSPEYGSPMHRSTVREAAPVAQQRIYDAELVVFSHRPFSMIVWIEDMHHNVLTPEVRVNPNDLGAVFPVNHDGPFFLKTREVGSLEENIRLWIQIPWNRSQVVADLGDQITLRDCPDCKSDFVYPR